MGVAGYPEGHPAIPEEQLIDALLAKQEHATHVTTQMTFDGDAIFLVDRPSTRTRA